MPTKDGKHAYSEEEKAEIIAHVLVNVACGRPVDRIFREDDMTENGIHIPAQSAFWKWLFQDETGEIEEKLARAREFGIEALLDKAIGTAETTMIGEEITEEPVMVDGKQVATVQKIKRGDMTAHRKLYIETMFKAAQMLKPKKYGAKLDLTTGGDKLNSMADMVRRGIAKAREEARREREGEEE